MEHLSVLIDQLLCHRNIHISILDLSGILSTPATNVDFKNTIHSKEFCCIAKSTEIGYHACLRCKQCANTKAINGKTSFYGHCVFGLYEAAVPVVLHKNVMAIIYVGNAVLNEKKTRFRIQKMCKNSGVSGKNLLEQLSQCERIDSPNELLQIGNILADYLVMLYENTPKIKTEQNWIVTLMKRYADERYLYKTSIREIAAACQKNEKYIGRIFKEEIGKSFNAYCTDLRLCRAEEQLSHSTDKIIDIALECGFSNVSYFNRAFKKKYGVSPTEYRSISLES